jgi:hypothetical protein
MTEQEARRLAAELTDIEIERLEYALGKEREVREIQESRAAQRALQSSFVAGPR